jgi:hypothetical protein
VSLPPHPDVAPHYHVARTEGGEPDWKTELAEWLEWSGEDAIDWKSPRHRERAIKGADENDAAWISHNDLGTVRSYIIWCEMEIQRLQLLRAAIENGEIVLRAREYERVFWRMQLIEQALAERLRRFRDAEAILARRPRAFESPRHVRRWFQARIPSMRPNPRPRPQTRARTPRSRRTTSVSRSRDGPSSSSDDDPEPVVLALRGGSA